MSERFDDRHQYRLTNGATVYLKQVPNSTSVTVIVGIKSGSRDDPTKSQSVTMSLLAGVHHFAEHVTTRATKNHVTWSALCREADWFSSVFNAYTDQSCVLNMIETDRYHVRQAIRFLGDIVKNPLLTKEHVDCERERIRQECRVYYDDPDERAYLDFDRLMFAGDGLAHPVLGDEKSIQLITTDDMRNFHRRCYVGQRLIILVIGNFDPELIKPTIRREFEGITPGTPIQPHHLRYDRLSHGFYLFQDDTLQVRTMLGWPMPPSDDPRRIVMYAIRNHMTNRSSSILKVALDSVGHGYSLGDAYLDWGDVGEYYVRVPVSLDHYRDTLRIFGEEIKKLRTELISADDLELAKTNLSICSRTHFNNNWESGAFIAGKIVGAGHFIPTRTFIKQVRVVTRHQIRDVANELLNPKRLMVVSRGPISGLHYSDLEPLLK